MLCEKRSQRRWFSTGRFPSPLQAEAYYDLRERGEKREGLRSPSVGDEEREEARLRPEAGRPLIPPSVEG